MVTRCVMKNDKKEKIWDLFDQKENANDIQTMILEYENEFSDDMDIFLMKMCLFIYENKIQAAIEIGVSYRITCNNGNQRTLINS